VSCAVEPGDLSPGIPCPSIPVTEGSGELVPVSVMSHNSTEDIVGASLLHPDAAGLKGAALRAPTASSSQMSGLVGATLNPDVDMEIEISSRLELSSGLEAGFGVQVTQPPHSLLEIEMIMSGTYGYLGTSGYRYFRLCRYFRFFAPPLKNVRFS